MHIILTHEHTDFDALGSLLAAALLYPEATAIVPLQPNHNVRDFLTLYWDELPFIERKERPFGKISQITLVDSQYIPHIRGRSKKTKVHIIDHHTQQIELSNQIELTLVETGATVSYLIEQIVQANIPITPIHATLMLLGIHEDTGSLTYGGTTLSDMRAATWLLEQGAKLDVLRNFLNYALTPGQTKLYNELLNVLTPHTIHGRQILIGMVEVEEEIDEMSSVAHRIRELYRPDALLLLIGFEDHIQLIARSTTDAVDVSQIAAAFGGGGHPRAAAAYIPSANLNQIQPELFTLLEKHVQPAAIVRQIMSYGVLVVAPDQSIQDAANLINRYGYEGYPVVKDDKLVGILTRREVDKALHHNLGQAKIGDYMHSGQIFVTPDDTIERLRDVMFHERIGQIPVMENGKIIGVVTRTDLINMWRQDGDQDSPKLNLTTRLTQMLPKSLFDLLIEAGEAATDIDCDLFIVGGFVRDLLLNRPGHDVDLVVEGDAIALAKAIQNQYGGRVRSHDRFRTATWILDEPIADTDRLDFVTARTEFYQHPTALPEVESSSIKQDLHRRDFTINTLAIRLNPQGLGEMIDFYGGYRDLQNKHLRILHSLSFVEDPTRIIRAIRLEQRLDFSIGQRTLEHLKNAIDLIPRLSHDRIFSELEYTFKKEAQPEQAMARMSDLGVLNVIHPDLAVTDWYRKRCQRLRTGLKNTPWSEITPNPRHYFGLLVFPMSQESTEEFIQTYHFPSSMEKLLTQVQALKRLAPELNDLQKPSHLYQRLQPYEEDALLIAWLAFDAAPARQNISYFCQTLRYITPLTTGTDLIEHFKLRPAPFFGKILNQLRDAHLDGQISTRNDEHALIQTILDKRDPT